MTPSDEIVHWIMVGLLVVMLVVLACTNGCASVCAKTWETSTEVSHSALWGPSVSQTVSVGGELGSSCHTKDEK